MTAEENIIKKKIGDIATPLQDWDINIYRGLLTGYNEAFIIDTSTKDFICEQDPKSAEIIKPILRGKDIKRYQSNWAGLWLIATHNGYTQDGIRFPRVKVENYPAVKIHLDKNYSQLEKRYDKGDTPYNLRNCAYLNEFDKEKIVWKAMGMGSDFTYIRDSIFTNDKGNILTSNGNDLKYLLAYFNSKVFLWQYSLQGMSLGNGFEFKVQFVEKIPVPKLDAGQLNNFIEVSR
jgi:hypothetical protein